MSDTGAAMKQFGVIHLVGLLATCIVGGKRSPASSLQSMIDSLKTELSLARYDSLVVSLLFQSKQYLKCVPVRTGSAEALHE